ncbi:hypothetical protein, partial [Pseudofulvimonas gallinarii]|uniref:hypothetical protein n=1 Tax=Pseudofulvimonas gallinarii TaxID=634155 RepID=UPI001B35DAB0
YVQREFVTNMRYITECGSLSWARCCVFYKQKFEQARPGGIGDQDPGIRHGASPGRSVDGAATRRLDRARHAILMTINKRAGFSCSVGPRSRERFALHGSTPPGLACLD